MGVFILHILLYDIKEKNHYPRTNALTLIPQIKKYISVTGKENRRP